MVNISNGIDHANYFWIISKTSHILQLNRRFVMDNIHVFKVTHNCQTGMMHNGQPANSDH
jgi:hypothetical protein